jgi:GPH family glycoside/pentoside/hexuronide:cation symporter
MDTAPRRASRATRLSYGVGELGVSLALSSIGSFLMFFYSDVAGLGIAAAGLVKGAGRVWDAINDPAVGYLSDRTRSRFGRRRPWFAIAAVPLGLAVGAAFSPPEGLSQTGLLLWMLAAYLVADTCFTLFQAPFYALGAELSDDALERTSIVATRTFFAYVGVVLGNMMPLFVAIVAGNELRRGYGTVAFGFGALAALTALAAFFGTREAPHAEPPRPASLADFARGVRVSFGNRPFRILLATFVTMSIGAGLNGAVAIYALIYWLGFSGAEAGLILPVFIGSAALSLPLWSHFGARYGKDRALKAVCIYEGFILCSIWFLTPERPLVYAFLALAGFGLAGFILAGSLLADVLDHDELTTGEQRAGAFFGFWTFANKLASGFGPLVVGPVLGALGYVANQPQSPEVILAMRLLYGPITAIFFVTAAVVFWRFPLDRTAHEAIQTELRKRREAAPVSA